MSLHTGKKDLFFQRPTLILDEASQIWTAAASLMLKGLKDTRKLVQILFTAAHAFLTCNIFNTASFRPLSHLL
jgi:hypothetical protein